MIRQFSSSYRKRPLTARRCMTGDDEPINSALPYHSSRITSSIVIKLALAPRHHAALQTGSCTTNKPTLKLTSLTINCIRKSLIVINKQTAAIFQTRVSKSKHQQAKLYTFTVDQMLLSIEDSLRENPRQNYRRYCQGVQMVGRKTSWAKDYLGDRPMQNCIPVS